MTIEIKELSNKLIIEIHKLIENIEYLVDNSQISNVFILILIFEEVVKSKHKFFSSPQEQP